MNITSTIKYVVQRKFANEQHGGTGWIDIASDDDLTEAQKELDFAKTEFSTVAFRLVKRTITDEPIVARPLL